MSEVFRIVVFISGNGSNLQALIDQQEKQQYKIVAVISNCSKAYGVFRARNANIPVYTIENNRHRDEEFEQKVMDIISPLKMNLIVLAGFMLVLSEKFLQYYQGRVINIHPSLLPRYKGLDTYKKALKNKDRFHGTTVHFVTKDIDSGAIILQKAIPILEQDTEISLRKKIQRIEHEIYPQIVHLIAQKRLLSVGGHIFCDGQMVSSKGLPQNYLESTADIEERSSIIS